MNKSLLLTCTHFTSEQARHVRLRFPIAVVQIAISVRPSTVAPSDLHNSNTPEQNTERSQLWVLGHSQRSEQMRTRGDVSVREGLELRGKWVVQRGGRVGRRRRYQYWRCVTWLPRRAADVNRLVRPPFAAAATLAARARLVTGGMTSAARPITVGWSPLGVAGETSVR